MDLNWSIFALKLSEMPQRKVSEMSEEKKLRVLSRVSIVSKED